jgi:hypothetical protein
LTIAYFIEGAEEFLWHPGDSLDSRTVEILVGNVFPSYLSSKDSILQRVLRLILSADGISLSETFTNSIFAVLFSGNRLLFLVSIGNKRIKYRDR